MPKSVVKYSIFLASPSDLEDERSGVEDVIKELNIIYGSRHNISLELLKWENTSAPGISIETTQSIINKDIGEEYDLFIGMIWKKFGTKTDIANSGTEEEFITAINRYKNNENIQILFYFKSATPLSLDDLDPNELLKINSFKTKLKNENVLFWSFTNLDNLKTQLRMHIPKRIDDLMKRETVQPKLSNETTIESEDAANVEELGLFDYLDSFEDLISNARVSLVNINEATTEIGAQMNRKADEITKTAKYPNPNRQLLTQHFKSTAKLLDNYSDRLFVESPLFYESFKDAVDAGLKFINLLDDFDEGKSREDLESLLSATSTLEQQIPNAIKGMKSFFESVKGLPRIQADLNKSKRKLLQQLEGLILRLRTSLDLTEQFSDDIAYKLSKLKGEN